MSFATDSIGGEYKHKLQEIEMPKHHHGGRILVKGYSGWDSMTTSDYGIIIDYSTKNYVGPKTHVNVADVTTFCYTGFAGDNVHHNNIQPYIVTYFWRRTK